MSSLMHPLIINDSEDDRISKPKLGWDSNTVKSTENQAEEENKSLLAVRRGLNSSLGAEQGLGVESNEGLVPKSQATESLPSRGKQGPDQPLPPRKTLLPNRYADRIIRPRKHTGSHPAVKQSERIDASSRAQPTRLTITGVEVPIIPKSKVQKTVPATPPTKPKRTVRFDEAGQNPLDDQLNHELAAATPKIDDLDPTLEVIPGSEPKPLTQKELEEMFEPKSLLPATDTEMERRYHELKEAASAFAQEYFPKDLAKPITSLDLVNISQETPELMEFINYIASPGEKGWEYQFRERKSLLVYGVLGKLMQAHFFGQEMFGASDRQLHTLRSIDWEMLDLDGFARQQVRACTINGFLSASDRTLPPSFISSISRFHAQILALLAPLRTSLSTVRYQDALRHVLLLGAKFSLDMRREPDTIYYITTILRDTIVEPLTTRIINPVELNAKKPWCEPYDSPIVRLVAWPGIVAYRAGSGRDDGGQIMGCRTRRIGRAEAYTEWGREPQPRGHPDHVPSLRDFVTAQAHGPAPPPATSTATALAPLPKPSTPASVDRKLLAAGAVGGVGVAGALWAARDVAHAAGTVIGGAATDVLRDFVKKGTGT